MQSVKILSFLLFAGLGITFPFLSLHFKNLGFSGKEMGLITALYPLFAFLSQIFSGILSDFTKNLRHFLKIILAGLALSLTALYFVQSFWPFFALYAVYSLFLSSALFLSNLGILEALNHNGRQYGKIRVFGSVGFLFSSLALSKTLDFTGISAIFLFFSAFSLLSFTALKAFPGRSETSEGFSLLMLKKLKNRAFWILIGITLLFQLSYVSLDLYLALLMKDLGAGPFFIGAAWALGVLAEIPVMAYSERLLNRLGILPYMALGMASGVIRWGVYAFYPVLPAIFAVQVLHGFTFACLYNGGIAIVSQSFSRNLQGTAQSVYDSFSRLAGYFLGTLFFGFLYDAGGCFSVFFWAFIAALLSLLFMGVFILTRNKKRSALYG